MRLVIASNYYPPYLSGMTEYARRLAEGLAVDHEVTVVTSRYDSSLPARETVRGVRVERTPVWLRVSKGVVSPGFPGSVIQATRKHDALNLHLPMLEAGLIAPLVPSRKLIVTYHCDIDLPEGLAKRLVEPPMFSSMRVALQRARRIAVTSLDYAEHSRTLRPFLAKCVEIAPPIPSYPPPRAKTGHAPTVGFLGRFVEEKGIEFLLQAMKVVTTALPGARLLLAGEHENVAGGSIMPRLTPLLNELGSSVEVLGRLADEAVPSFFGGLDVLALPSVNSFEAFGMVQVEAMLNGTPVVTTDLPGVRTIVQRTGMGMVVPRRDPVRLAEALLEVLQNPGRYRRDVGAIRAIYSEEVTQARYLRLFGRRAGIMAEAV